MRSRVQRIVDNFVVRWKTMSDRKRRRRRTVGGGDLLTGTAIGAASNMYNTCVYLHL